MFDCNLRLQLMNDADSGGPIQFKLQFESNGLINQAISSMLHSNSLQHCLCGCLIYSLDYHVFAPLCGRIQ